MSEAGLDPELLEDSAEETNGNRIRRGRFRSGASRRSNAGLDRMPGGRTPMIATSANASATTMMTIQTVVIAQCS